MVPEKQPLLYIEPGFFLLQRKRNISLLVNVSHNSAYVNFLHVELQLGLFSLSINLQLIIYSNSLFCPTYNPKR